MDSYQSLAKLLIITGILILAVGVFLLLTPKMPFIGKLPGDILIRRKNFTFYFPMVSLLILNVLIFLIWHFLKK
jgi:uncharacterized protein HemY